MPNDIPQSSGDSGSGQYGINLGAHVTGNPFAGGAGSGSVTIGHTVAIIVFALVLLWVLGYVFRGVRL